MINIIIYIMAARIDAAVFGSLIRCCLIVYAVCVVCVKTCSQARHAYSQSTLLNIGLRCQINVTCLFHHAHNIPQDIARPPGSAWIVFGPGRRRRRCRERLQKRGCRGGLLAQLKSNHTSHRYQPFFFFFFHQR